MFETILRGISKSGLKESLQNINISLNAYFSYNIQKINSPGYFEYDMKEIMKKYGLEKIKFNNNR